MSFFEILSIELSTIHEYGWCTVDKFAGFWETVGEFGEQHRNNAIDDDGDQRFPGGFQFGGQLRGDGADGDAGDLVKEVQLRHLFMPHHFGNQK